MLRDSPRHSKMDEGKAVVRSLTLLMEVIGDPLTPPILADALHPPQTGEGCREVGALLVEVTSAPQNQPIFTDTLHPPQIGEGCRVVVVSLVDETASPVTLMSSRLRRKLGLIDKPTLQTNHKLRNAQRSAVVANLGFGDFKRNAVTSISSKLRRKLGLIDKPIHDAIKWHEAPRSTVMVDLGFGAWKMDSRAVRTRGQSALRPRGERSARGPA